MFDRAVNKREVQLINLIDSKVVLSKKLVNLPGRLFHNEVKNTGADLGGAGHGGHTPSFFQKKYYTFMFSLRSLKVI